MPKEFYSSKLSGICSEWFPEIFTWLKARLDINRKTFFLGEVGETRNDRVKHVNKFI